MRFALLSDFHYGYPEDEEMEEYLEPVIKEMIEQINEFSPEFVVALGDFIQHLDASTDLERLKRVGELMDGIEAPVYAIPGNHDPMTVSKEEVMQKLDVQNMDTYFSIDTSDRKLIFLDTITQVDDIYGVGLIGSEQREWMEEEFQAEKEVLVFSHHLLHYRNLEDNWYFDDKPELAAAIDKKNFQKIAGKNLRAVFSAHIHSSGVEEFNEVPHFTTSGMDKYNPPERFKKNHAFVEVSDEKINFETSDQLIEWD